MIQLRFDFVPGNFNVVTSCFQNKEKGHLDISNDETENADEEIMNNTNPLPKKKIKKKQNSKEKKERALKKTQSEHPMREKCEGKCKRQCSDFTEQRRNTIWENFWSLDYTSRRKWMSCHITLVPVKRILTTAIKNRKDSRFFSLPIEDGISKPVCRKTFLNTLGYKHDSILTHLVPAMKAAPCGNMVKERRGIHPKSFKINRAPIEEHINIFHPCISHYRRKNAPNVKYLPRDLTCKMMFDDFKDKNPDIKCSLEVYRKVIKDLNISFNMPMSDKCEDCTNLENKVKESSDDDSKQKAEEDLQKHKQKASRAEGEYKKDVIAAEKSETRFYSMDLQKVIILPIMPECKSSFFTSRLIVFNETFATINPNSKNTSYCVFWHEAIGNRKAEAIADSVLKVLEVERDVGEFVFWADNCSAQNKNYVLFSFLIATVNSKEGPKKITIKYLTKGHTHMTADGVHGNIESKIRHKRNVYDFKDLIETAGSARRNLKVLLLDKFHLFQNKKRTTKKSEDPLKTFLLSNIVEACFEKGKFTIDYKYDFEEPYKTVNVFQKKYIDEIKQDYPKARVLPVRGINSSKKEKILRTLVPLMPENRRKFWADLPESDCSNDLTNKESCEIEDD